MDFDITVEMQRNKYNNKIMQSVMDIRKKEREVTKKIHTETKFKNKMRHVCEEGDLYLKKYRP